MARESLRGKMIPKSQNRRELEEGKTIEYRILIVDEDQKTASLTKKSIERPYVGDICKHEKMFNRLIEGNYDMLIIDNDSGLGCETLKRIRSVNKDLPIIYRSTNTNVAWLKSGTIEEMGAHLHDTSQTIGPEVNSLIQQYIGRRCEEK